MSKFNESNEHQKTNGRSEIDPLFKEVLDFRFGQLGIPIKTQVEVSRLPRTIDVMLILGRKSDLESTTRLSLRGFLTL